MPASSSRATVAPTSASPPTSNGSRCPCKPLKSRELVAAADIVITNHSMIAVQAATGAPVVIGSAKLGQFDGIIIDEAHALPSIVRNQGQSEVSGRRILSAVRKVKGVLSDRDPHIMKWIDDGHHVADYVENELAGKMSAKDVNA
jgi:ATP-dependent DNA helicase DinG